MSLVTIGSLEQLSHATVSRPRNKFSDRSSHSSVSVTSESYAAGSVLSGDLELSSDLGFCCMFCCSNPCSFMYYFIVRSAIRDSECYTEFHIINFSHDVLLICFFPFFGRNESSKLFFRSMWQL